MWYPREHHVRTKFPRVPIAPGGLDRAGTPEVKPFRCRSDPTLLKRAQLSPIATTLESGFGSGPGSGLEFIPESTNLGNVVDQRSGLVVQQFPDVSRSLVSDRGLDPSSQVGAFAGGPVAAEAEALKQAKIAAAEAKQKAAQEAEAAKQAAQAALAAKQKADQEAEQHNQSQQAATAATTAAVAETNSTKKAELQQKAEDLKKKADEALKKKQAADDAAAAKKQAEQDAISKKQAADAAAAAKEKAEQAALTKKQVAEQEAAAAKQKAHEEAAKARKRAGGPAAGDMGIPPYAGEDEVDLAKRLKRETFTRELDAQVATCLDQVRRMLRQSVKQGDATGKGNEANMQPREKLSKLNLKGSSLSVGSLQDYLQSAMERMQTTVGDKVRLETQEYHREAVAERRKVDQIREETEEEIELGRDRETALIHECEMLNKKTKALQEQDEAAMQETKHLVLALRNAEAERSTAMKQRLKKENDATSRIETLLDTQQNELRETQGRIADLKDELEQTVKLESVEVEECRQRSEQQTRERLLPEEEVCDRLRAEARSAHHEEVCAVQYATGIKQMLQDLLVERWDEMRLRMPPRCLIPDQPSRAGLKYLERQERIWNDSTVRQLRMAKLYAEQSLHDVSEIELPKVHEELRAAHEENEKMKEDLGRHAEVLGEQAALNGVLGVEFDEETAEHERAMSAHTEWVRSCAARQLQQMARCTTSTSKKKTEAEELCIQTQKLKEQISASNANIEKLSALASSGQSNMHMLDEQIAALETQCEAARDRTGGDYQEREMLMGNLQQTQAYMDRLDSNFILGSFEQQPTE